jgi:NosR/NirI family nitrous oxide reductase transcriptional regulator
MGSGHTTATGATDPADAVARSSAGGGGAGLPAQKTHRATPRWGRVALQLYRLAILVGIAWVIRAHHLHLKIGGEMPITFSEVKEIYPAADFTKDDPGHRSGIFVYDADDAQIGYVVRTMPFVETIIGYRGWTDALIAFDPALKVIGVRIRATQDTRDHVSDVKGDPYFLKTWNGKHWEEIARTTPEDAGIEGVSGATMTSMAVAEGITRRLTAADEAGVLRPPPFRVRARDVGLVLVIIVAITLAYTGTYGRKWVRRAFQVFVIVYVGFLTGDLLAQSLFVGWAEQGATPWRTAPGLVLLVAAALAVPWVTGKPLYCQQICPHGAAQELLSRISPKHWRINLRSDFAAGLKWLPTLLLGFILAVSVLVLPIDIAHVEPFDAYLIKAAGVATIAIALTGLIASLFVPMAYCRYGCPTGALLEFVRAHGCADRFSRRDFAALLLLLLASTLSSRYHEIRALMMAGV